jgi:hypothetical protein
MRNRASIESKSIFFEKNRSEESYYKRENAEKKE